MLEKENDWPFFFDKFQLILLESMIILVLTLGARELLSEQCLRRCLQAGRGG